MTEVTRKDNIISRGLQGCHRSEMSVLVHSWATSLQANSLLLNFTDIPVRSEKPFTISFFENSLSGSVHPCTLFNVEFAEQTRYCSISRTSLSVLKSLLPLAFLKIACPEVYIRVHCSTSSLRSKLATAQFHGHPCPF